TATPSGKVGRRQIRQRALQKCEALFFLSIALGVIAFKLVSLQLQTQRRIVITTGAKAPSKKRKKNEYRERGNAVGEAEPARGAEAQRKGGQGGESIGVR
ncbi:MAG: hypothetical protein MR791_04880, partial [Bacteroidales bacterium]|nr:hypothetical protein [Bacteroidales bacterium]